MQKIEPKYIAFLAMILGMFMAILDIQIVASSLSVIAAGLSASVEELSWIQTSYMIAEAIVIPVTGFLCRAISTRILYSIATAGFTIMSVACAFAANIEQMIAFRAMQGFFGGAMIPTAFSSLFTFFNQKERAVLGVMLGLFVTLAPTFGPTIGGYITNYFSWHVMFLINIVPGLIVTGLILKFCDFDKPNLKLFDHFDYIGLLLIIISLGGLQYILEEGAKYAWFDSSFIIYSVVLIVIAVILLIIYELRISEPIIHLRAFWNLNFTLGCIINAIIGIGLFGVVYIMPLFLYKIAGLDTLQIGTIMMVTGGSQFCIAPIAGRIASKLHDKRGMLAIGLIVFASGCYLNSGLTADARFHEFFLPQVFRGAALMLCFIPLNEIVFSTMQPVDVQRSSGLYNLTRNIGGAFGLAIMNTTIISDTKIFYSILSSDITMNVNSANKAQIFFLSQLLQRDSFVIAINDMFTRIAILFLCLAFIVIFLKPPHADNEITTSVGH